MKTSPCNGVMLVAGDDEPGQSLKHLGEDCSSGSCADDLYCSSSTYVPDAGLKTCRTCKARSRVGEECGGGCLEPAFCDYQPDAGKALCFAPRADGQPCTSTAACTSGFCNYRTYRCDGAGRTGDACTTQQDCRQGYCDSSSKCAAYVANGGPCTADGQCSNGVCDLPSGSCGLPLDAGCSSSIDTRCASGFCNNQGHCDVAKPNGQVCSQDAECVSRYCSSSRICVDHCNDDSECDGGMRCSFDRQQCEAPRADGQSCRGDEDCASNHCSPSEVCVTQKQVGEACASSDACTLDATCTNGTCTKKPGPGQACTGLESCQQPYVCIQSKCTLINLACRPAKAGEMCAYFRVCDDAAYCDFSADITCKPRSQAGGMCSSDEQCLDGWCSSALCVAHKADGAQCTENKECKKGSACVGGKCAVSAIGTPCDSYDAPCPAGYWCGTRDTCLANLVTGERCSSGSDSHCASGLYCNGAYECAPQLAAGAECDGYRDGECGPTHYCKRDMSPYHCVALPSAGEACDSRAGCAMGAYCSGTTCEAAKDNGQSCSGNQQCKSGVCDYSVGCLAGNMCLP